MDDNQMPQGQNRIVPGRKHAPLSETNKTRYGVDGMAPARQNRLNGSLSVPSTASSPPLVTDNVESAGLVRDDTEVKRPSRVGMWLHICLELILVIVVVALGWYTLNLRQDNQSLRQEVAQAKNNPQAVVQQQTDALIRQVGTLMQLPAGETPTVANVSDAAQAKQQSAFFANAQNGDKVLMYVKAGQAILYRPSTNKVILVAPLTFTNNTSAATPSTSKTSTANR